MDIIACECVYPMDAIHKWRNYEKLLLECSKNEHIDFYKINSICDIGCGSGDILDLFQKSNLFKKVKKFDGYDINSNAISKARKNYPNINFFSEDLLKTNNEYDLLTCTDVFEHVLDVYYFLNNLKNYSKYFLFNIPLESSFFKIMLGEKELRKSYKYFGHLHFYSAASAILTLELSGYKIIKKTFAKDKTSNFYNSKSIKNLIKAIPPLIIQKFSPYLSAALFGDHLVVLAKRK